MKIKMLMFFFIVSKLIWNNTLFAEDKEAQIEKCNSCHNASETISSDQIGPNLAGQKSVYLIEQIKLFQNNVRFHPLLNAKEAGLNHDVAQHLAIHYQSIKSTDSVKTESHDAAVIYEPCAGCHGEKGEGVGPFPRLNGLKSLYLEQQLADFKNGKRQNSLMQGMTINLSEQDIKLLASYLGK